MLELRSYHAIIAWVTFGTGWPSTLIASSCREAAKPDRRHRTLFFRDPEDNIIEIYAEY
jgi:hypothetical protein